MLRAFPNVHFLGRDLHGLTGPPSYAHARFILNQHTRNAARDGAYLFHIANTRLRAEACRGVVARVRNHPEDERTVAGWVIDDEWQGRCAAAAKRPDTREAKVLEREINKVVISVAAHVPWSEAQRSALRAQMHALTQRFGAPPSIFLSFSPNDAGSATGLRLSLRTGLPMGWNAHSFPAWDAGFASWLVSPHHATARAGELDTFFDVPFSKDARQALAAANGAVHAQLHDHIVRAVLDVLLGLKSADETRTTTPVEKQSRSVFGFRTLGYILVTEGAERGALHGHAMVWPYEWDRATLDRAATASESTKSAVTAMLDAMIVAELPNESASRDAIRLAMREPPTIHPAIAPMPDALAAPDAFRGLRDLVIAECNRHNHCFTCHKPPAGCEACRGGYPRPLIESTRVVRVLTAVQYNGAVGADPTLQRKRTTRGFDTFWTLKLQAPQPSPYVLGPPRCACAKYNDPLCVLPASLHPVRATAEAPCPSWHDDPALVGVTRPDFNVTVWEFQRRNHDALLAPGTLQRMQEVEITDLVLRLFPAKQARCINGLHPERRLAVLSLLEKASGANGMIVQTNPTLAVCLRCNTNVELVLGEAANYLVNYTTKNPEERAMLITLMKAAVEHITKFPSSADNANEPTRQATYLLEHVVNKLPTVNGSKLSAPMAAAVALGIKAHYAGCQFKWVFPGSYVAGVHAVRAAATAAAANNEATMQIDVQPRFDTDQAVDDDERSVSGSSGMSSRTSVISQSTDKGAQGDGDGAFADLDEGITYRPRVTGNRRAYKVVDADGHAVMMSMRDHYLKRGNNPLVAALTPAEWDILCYVAPKPTGDEDTTNGDGNDDTADGNCNTECGHNGNDEVRGDNGGYGNGSAQRRRNHAANNQTRLSCELGSNHPLHATHRIVIAKQLCTPIYGGGVPRWPDPALPNEPVPRRIIKQRARFARWALPYFSVYDENTEEAVPVSWDALIALMDALEMKARNGDGVAAGRLRQLKALKRQSLGTTDEERSAAC